MADVMQPVDNVALEASTGPDVDLRETETLSQKDTDVDRASSAPAAEQQTTHDDDADSDRMCRVCRGDDDILYSPCLCKGSISFVHQECLLEWLEVSGKKKCELCGYPYRFSALYSRDKPQQLGLVEFVQIACLKFVQVAPRLLRYVFVAAIWLLVVPFFTCWIFRLWMLRSKLGFLEETETYFQAGYIQADLLSGVFICLAALVVALAAFSFIDIVMSVRAQQQLHAWNGPEVANNDENGDNNLNGEQDAAAGNYDEADPDQAGDHVDPAAAQVERDRLLAQQLQAEADAEHYALLAQQAGRRNHLNLNLFGNGLAAQEQAQRVNAAAAAGVAGRANGEAAGNEAEPAPAVPIGGGDAPRQNGVHGAHADNDVAAELGAAGEEDARAQDQPAVNAEEPDPAVGAADGAGANVLLEADMELQIDGRNILGFDAPLLHLVCNVAVALGIMAICLGLVVRMPISFSQFLLSSAQWAAHRVAPDLVNYTDQHADNMLWWLHRNNSTAAVRPDDVLHALFGWLMTVVCLAAAAAVLAAAQRVYGGSILLYDLYNSGLESVLSVFKLGTILFLKMIIFPLMFGIGLALATEPLFDYSNDDLWEFFMETPLCFCLVQWVVGVSYMLLDTFCLLELRSVLHPEVLANIIRLPDPEQQMLRNLLLEETQQIVGRMCISTVVYMIPLVLLIWLPIQTTIWVKESMYGAGTFEPVHLQFRYYWFGVQLPIELAIVHVAFLHIIENVKGPIRQLQETWLNAVCTLLSLDRWLLPREMPADEAEVATKESDEKAIGQDGDGSTAAAETVPVDGARTDETTAEEEPAIPEAQAAAAAAAAPAQQGEGDDETENNDGHDDADGEETRRLYPREAPATLFVPRMAAFYILAWLSVLIVFVTLAVSIFCSGRFLLHSALRIENDNGHDVASLLVGGIFAHIVLQGCQPIAATLRRSWRARMANNGFGQEKTQKTTHRGLAMARAARDYFSAAFVGPFIFGHILARVFFSTPGAGGGALTAFHPALAAAVNETGTDGTDLAGPAMFLRVCWCIFEDWIIGAVGTLALLEIDGYYDEPAAAAAAAGGNDAAGAHGRGQGHGQNEEQGNAAPPQPENANAVAPAVPAPGGGNADTQPEGPAELVLICPNYIFSLYTPLMGWMLTIVGHILTIELLLWLDVPSLGAVVAAGVQIPMLAAAAFYVVPLVLVRHWDRAVTLFQYVHMKLLEERYRVGWQLHNLGEEPQVLAGN